MRLFRTPTSIADGTCFSKKSNASVGIYDFVYLSGMPQPPTQPFIIVYGARSVTRYSVKLEYLTCNERPYTVPPTISSTPTVTTTVPPCDVRDLDGNCLPEVSTSTQIQASTPALSAEDETTLPRMNPTLPPTAPCSCPSGRTPWLTHRFLRRVIKFRISCPLGHEIRYCLERRHDTSSMLAFRLKQKIPGVRRTTFLRTGSVASEPGATLCFRYVFNPLEATAGSTFVLQIVNQGKVDFRLRVISKATRVIKKPKQCKPYEP
eukprot:m.193188 g.193188  ORF g.193188 m.193188 type:complete len:263 (+) comp16976_c0_seq1:2705-3493(+)